MDASTFDETGNIAAGPRQAGHEAAANRIGNGGENHRDDGGFALHGSGGGCGVDENHIGIEAEQFFRKGAVFVCIPGTVTKVDCNIAIECPAEIGKTLQKGGNAPLRGGIILSKSNESADPQHAFGHLLRMRWERPRRGSDRRSV